MKKIISAIVFLSISCISVFPQTTPFDIHIEPMNIAELGGLQSFAWGQHNGKWLIIGGRLDGLHRRQPFAAFDIAGHNTQLIVVDPATSQKWSMPIDSLSVPLQEQLKSTNMQFQQRGKYLYLTGGYGYSGTLGDHTTFSSLTAVDVPAAIDAIVAGNRIVPCFRQISDARFQVTGGNLEQINNTFYLIGGHKFIGRYNPRGPAHGPGFIQEYTNQIRKFNLYDDGSTISITHFPPITDSVNLHRRDFNAVPQILQNRAEGITAFSGVFQPNIDLPFLDCVNIDSLNYVTNNSFRQYYNHYHCAVLPLYDGLKNEMHNVFFGGIAQYFDSAGVLVQDGNVPFVNTISRVTRNSEGKMAEYKLPVKMPSLLGAGAEFIPASDVPRFKNDVLKLNAFASDSTLVGYIYGGISSTAANIFFSNTGAESAASSMLFKVYVVKKAVMPHVLNNQSIGTLNMQVFPNFEDNKLLVKFHLKQLTETKISLYTIGGEKIEEKILTNTAVGENRFQRKIRKLDLGGVYILTIETAYEKATQKIIIEP